MAGNTVLIFGSVSMYVFRDEHSRCDKVHIYGIVVVVQKWTTISDVRFRHVVSPDLTEEK